MDFSYIAPRCIQLLDQSVLLKTMAEYRMALRLLDHDRTPAAEDLRQQLMASLELVRAEIARREALYSFPEAGEPVR